VVKAQIIVCPKCGRVRIHGWWKILTINQCVYLDMKKDEWEKVPVFCPPCKESLPRR
jgi:hypothetical protein